MVPGPSIRGIPEIMVGRLLSFMWSFGVVEWRVLACHSLWIASPRGLRGSYPVKAGMHRR